MRRSFTLLACWSFVLLAGPASAVAPREETGFLDGLAVADPRLRPSAVIQPIEEAGAAAAPRVLDGWTAFRQAEGGEWYGYIDRRNGLLEIAEGPGIPWVPGPGNQLTRQDIAAHLTGAEVDLKALESIARAFLPRVAPLLGVDPKELVLSRERSGRFGDQAWFVDFDLQRGGRIVEGARVVFRVSHGNLMQLGTENLPAVGQPAPERETVRREEALATLAAHIRGFGAADTFLDGGSLHLLPAAVDDDRFTDGFEAGNGRGLVLVWQLVFRRQKEAGTWRARIDAVSGELLELVDTNRYARAHGGVYPVTSVGETTLPMPFADLSSGGATDSSGAYAYPGSPVTSSLDGPYVSLFDNCGSIALTSSGSGRLSFGTSGGTDCATPGRGGAGNTHSSRTQFYYLNRIKEVGRSWLPGSSWLASPLIAQVNIWDTCNAYWDGWVNFFLAGGGCGNTGEIAAISLHEYGHGLDDYDGISSSDYGTGEAYADITAALLLRDSCIGPGFILGGNCDGFGDACTSCSGVRDIDWAKHVSNTPHTVANFTQSKCWDSFYSGPCGAQGHCESHIISEAVWDLAMRDLPDPGSNAAWAITERLWYLSRPTATSAFTCNRTTSPWTSNGCGTGSLWRTLRAVDDDDGNLANGTPHSCQIYAALNRHGIACPADPGANVCFSACTPPAAPTLSATAGQEQVQLSWSGGAGLVYDVYESEMGCSSGWRRVANDLSSTSLLDTVVFPDRSHSYQVIAHPAGQEACSSPPSACQSALPTGPACTPPAVPSGVAAVATRIDRVQVSWNAVAGATDYQVLRSLSAGGPFAPVATVAAPTTQWTDQGVSPGTTYFYAVRSAFDDCLSTASAAASIKTPTCQTTTLYTNDFETGSGLSDWTPNPSDSSPEWRGLQTCPAHSGNRIFRFGGAGCNDSYQNGESGAVRILGTTGLQVPAVGSSTRLSFWHRWGFESGYDGGYLTVSINGSAELYVAASQFISGGYNQASWFSGTQSTFVRSEVDLEKVCDGFFTGPSTGCAGLNLRISFWASVDSIISSTGWFIDDVAITTCTLKGCTGAPQIGSVTAPADNRLQVAWSNGSPASSAFNVYRALGPCDAAGPFEKVASGVAGTSYLDPLVSGEVLWSYRVTGLDASGFCESELSACLDGATTGLCTVPPAFAGLAAATNAASATCGIDLSWPAASSRCGEPVTYDIFRSADPGFTPGPETWIASGITGTSWTDTAALEDRTTYNYVVRAVDAGSGRSEANTVKRSAETTGEVLPLTLVETFEAAGGFDHPGWEHRALSGPNDWSWSTVWSKSPAHSWLAPSWSSSADRELVSPPFRATANTTLSFWHTYEFDSCFDGGTLEISGDGGATWSVVPDAAFTAGAFNGVIGAQSNPLYGLNVWCGGTAGSLTQVAVDLSGWEGHDVRLRWHAGEDSVIRYIGWYVDDVTIADAEEVQTCQTAVSPASTAHDFFTVPPCRILDTRGLAGAPALSPSAQRGLTVTGSCGIPSTARAVVLNLTVVQPGGPGYVTLFPTGISAPLTSTITFGSGQLRSNIAVVPLGLGTGALGVKNGSNSAVHLVVDVSGYFE